MAVNLNLNQKNALQGFIDSSHYADGYRYLRDVVNQQIQSEVLNHPIPTADDRARSNDLMALAAWFDAAAHINADDGSFVSEFVRGTTEGVMVYQGAPVTDTQFQTSSDTLAITLMNQFIQNSSIGTAQQVVNADIQNAVDTLNMPPWAWAGAITDFLPEPFGMNQDLASVPLDKVGVMSDASQMGLIRAFDRMLRDGVISTLEEFKSIIAATGNSVFDMLFPSACNSGINSATNALFTSAQTFIQRFGDPLTLDLNGNGIETVPLKVPPLLFDINASGIKIGTGWIAPDDGLLVLDRNGNGTVDSGAELFGDATPAYDAAGNPTSARTADGFAALAQEDSNADGVVNALDARFADLKVWRDLNQDGISQPDELTSLADAGIASFNTARTLNSQMLPSGNQMADLGTFTRADGSTGATGAPQGMADINLALDTFHRSFADSIPPTAAALALPDMQGSGKVRDLREVANEAVFEMRRVG